MEDPYELPDGVKNRLCLDDHQIQELQNAFELFDTSNSGFISLENFEYLCKSLGLQRCYEDNTDFDPTHGTGKIDFTHFLLLTSQKLSRRVSYQAESDLREAFDLFDMDNKGYLNAEDLKYVMENLGDHVTDEDIAEMLKEADLTKNSQISYEEFRHMMHRPTAELQ